MKMRQVPCNIQVEHGSEELRSAHGFWVCVHCDLDDMTAGQGHDTHLDHDNNCVKYYPDQIWQ